MTVAPPHPATLPPDVLRKQCETRRLRRSGPGGQHRNKVETAVVLRHKPTGVEAEANERRSQSQNATAALHRLRLRLAVEVRSAAGHPSGESPSVLWQSRVAGGAMRVSDQHEDFPALLAESLDRLAANAWDDRLTANELGVSRTALVRLLRSESAALAILNTERANRNLPPLR